MFFFRNKHIMIDLGTSNNNKIHVVKRQILYLGQWAILSVGIVLVVHFFSGNPSDSHLWTRSRRSSTVFQPLKCILPSSKKVQCWHS